MPSLRANLIRLARTHPGLQEALLPLLRRFGKGVPRDVYLRAGRRWLDALERKGFEGAVRATEIRIKAIKPGSPKAEGLAQYLKAWMKEEKPQGSEKSMLQKLISTAEAKARG